MMRYAVSILILMVAATMTRAGGAGLSLTCSIPLPGVEGRIDHLTADSAGSRLFVAALGNNSVEIIDCAARKVVRSIGGLHEPQDVCYLSQLDRLVVANGENGMVVEFDASSAKQVQSLKLRGDADNIRKVPGRPEVVVGYGMGALALIDPESMEVKGEIRIAGHPESFQPEDGSDRVYVNDPSAGSVLIADRSSMKVDATVKLTEEGANFPMALDEAHHHLFIGCRRPPRLLMLDTQSGRVLARIETHHDADDLFFDSARSCVYLSCGEGYVDVLRVKEQGLEKAGSIKSARGARTSYFDQRHGLLYLAVPRSEGTEARIDIFNTGGSVK